MDWGWRVSPSLAPLRGCWSQGPLQETAVQGWHTTGLEERLLLPSTRAAGATLTGARASWRMETMRASPVQGRMQGQAYSSSCSSRAAVAGGAAAAMEKQL